jgi:hypothetical protein
MRTMHAPSAATVSIAEVLHLLDNSFADVSAAAETRGFALWVGSGISLGRAPSVGSMLERALEHLRRNIDATDANCRFRRALEEALAMSDLLPAEKLAIRLDRPADSWPEKGKIIRSLWDAYASVLDIRVDGEQDDYMLWNAVDVRATFGTLDDPDCEHLCIAILVMEGAIADIASANWDGLIEKAIERLSGGEPLLQVVVDPDDLRDPAGRRSRLIKFHGCAIYATREPNVYRAFLTATRPQITFWPHNPRLAALRTMLRGVATNSRTLMVGLSLQDTNLQDLFAAARADNPWPWRPAPAPRGHVFCTNEIGVHQINMLRVVYHAEYGSNGAAIEASALIRAYAKPALLGFVLHLLCAKLTSLASRACGGPLAGASAEIAGGLRRLRDYIAALADGDRLTFLNRFIELWSRGMALFRRGDLPAAGSQNYEVISPLSAPEMAADPNIDQSGLPELAIGLGLLGRGEAQGKWTLSRPSGLDIDRGTFQATGTWASAKTAQIFFVSGPTAAIELINRGALKNDYDIILHSDDAWQRMLELEDGSGGRRTPTGTSRRRIGRRRARHVSIRKLLGDAHDIASLSQRFEEEMTL